MAFFSVSQTPVSHTEKMISGMGAFVSILLVALISQYFLDEKDYWLVVPSMGASAVLLFAVPHGLLSQPWPLVGGNVISAFIGVSAGLYIPDLIFAMSVAVGVSVLAMYYLKCIHPPGGATALIAALGGESIQSMGYYFVVTPILLNVMIILLVAIAFNALFHWRRYPYFINNIGAKPKAPALPTQQSGVELFNHEDFVNALKEIDSFVDINENDLKRIFELVNINHNKLHLKPEQIKQGCFYSNGQLGKAWAVRKIIEELPQKNPAEDQVVFKQISGEGRCERATISRNEFANWAKYEMTEHNGCWTRKIEQD